MFSAEEGVDDSNGWSPVIITVQDGLRLHIRDYRPTGPAGCRSCACQA